MRWNHKSEIIYPRDKGKKSYNNILLNGHSIKMTPNSVIFIDKCLAQLLSEKLPPEALRNNFRDSTVRQHRESERSWNIHP